MSSEIDWQNIDETFPVEGRDNPSQGFRDNFNAIKNALAIASNEVSDLQTDTIKKEGLEDTNLEGVRVDFVNTKIILSDIVNGSTLENNRIIVAGSDAEGFYYQFLVDTNFITINFDYWPENVYAKVRVELISDGTARTVKLQSIPTSSGVQRYKSNSNELELDPPTITTSLVEGGSKIVDVWTTDGGVTMYIDYIGEFIERS
jgi:hypothetical protein